MLSSVSAPAVPVMMVVVMVVVMVAMTVGTAPRRMMMAVHFLCKEITAFLLFPAESHI